MVVIMKYMKEQLKNYNVFKISFVILTTFLLYEEFYVFFIEKPTHSSLSKLEIEPDDYPDITICPFPSYNQTSLKTYGYKNSYEYAKGVIGGSHLRGWNGNTSNTSLDDIIQNISVIRTQGDCPYAKVRLVDTKNDQEKYAELAFEVTAVVHPNGRCCRAIIPDHFSNWTLGGLMVVQVILQGTAPVVEGFQVYLSDRESFNVFHRNEFNVDGSELRAWINELGYVLYNLKIFKEIYLENNQNYACKNYPNIADYNMCLQETYLDQTLSIVDCTPPWITANRNLWCHDLLDLSTQKSDKFEYFLSSLTNNRGDKSKCMQPCKSIWYKTARIGFDSRSDRFGLFINFLSEVEETKSKLNIETITLLTRIGGIIGVGKEFLWILTMTVTGLLGLSSYICKYVKC